MFQSIILPWIPIKYRSKDISGQTALVTGAGGGIGRLLAVGLARLGCKVVCCDIAEQGTNIIRQKMILFDSFEVSCSFGTANKETVRIIREEIKGIAYAYQVDLTKREEIYKLAERVKREIGTVSLLYFLLSQHNSLLIHNKKYCSRFLF